MEKKTLYRYFGNCATEEERIQVLEWTKASPKTSKSSVSERNNIQCHFIIDRQLQRTQIRLPPPLPCSFATYRRVVHTMCVVSIGSFYSRWAFHRSSLLLTVTAVTAIPALADGTKVWSIAGSTIKYLDVFGNATQYRNRRRKPISKLRPHRWKTIYRNTCLTEKLNMGTQI